MTLKKLLNGEFISFVFYSLLCTIQQEQQLVNKRLYYFNYYYQQILIL